MFSNLLGKLMARKTPGRDAALVDTLYQQGAGAYQAGRYPEAVRCAEQAISLDPSLAAIHFLLGSAQFELREYKAAETALAACLALKPSYPMVMHAQMRWALARSRASLASGRAPRIAPDEAADGRRISIIICSIKPERFDRICANYHALLAKVQHEIIGIHDARSLCEGYNRGIRRATGEILVFSHDDIEILSSDFAARLLAHLARYDLIGVAGTTRVIGGNWLYAGWPHIHGQIGSPGTSPGSIRVRGFQIRGLATPNAQAIDGIFLAARREVVERIGFDETTFDGWHLYDLDFTYSAHLAGFRTAVCHDLCLVHDSIGDYGKDWEHYARRFEEKYRDRLPRGEVLQLPELCLIEASSPAEWLLMCEEMTSRQESAPA
ncbi:MAG TPA: glycosyltransferase [Gemmatimonadales bacterium]|nr:glycosyltransferase [Gemmatimonadales bacterium]